MKRWMKWLLPLLAVLVIGGFVLRAIQAKKAEQAKLATPLAAPRIELAASDVLTLRRTELARTVEVSGGLKAVTSAIVKARVAGELRALSVREGDTVRAGQVIGPADRLFSATLRRGVQRGEFRAMPEHDVAHALMAPLIFMTLCRQSFGAGQRGAPAVDPQALIATHLDLVLHGLLARPVPPPVRTPAKNKKQVEQRA